MQNWSIDPFLGPWRPQNIGDVTEGARAWDAQAMQAKRDAANAEYQKQHGALARDMINARADQKKATDDLKVRQQLAHWADVMQSGETPAIRAGAARAYTQLGGVITEGTQPVPDEIPQGMPQAEGPMPTDAQMMGAGAPKAPQAPPVQQSPSAKLLKQPQQIDPLEMSAPQAAPQEANPFTGEQGGTQIASKEQTAQTFQQIDPTGAMSYPKRTEPSGVKNLSFQGEDMGIIDPGVLDRQMNAIKASLAGFMADPDTAMQQAVKEGYEMAPELVASMGAAKAIPETRAWVKMRADEIRMQKHAPTGGGAVGSSKAAMKLSAQQNADLMKILQVTNQQYKPIENVQSLATIDRVNQLLDSAKRSGLKDTVALNLLSKELNGVRASDPDFRRLAEGEGKITAFDNWLSTYTDAGLKDPAYIDSMRQVFGTLASSAHARMRAGGQAAARLAQTMFGAGGRSDELTQAAYEYYDPLGSWHGGTKAAAPAPKAPPKAVQGNPSDVSKIP
jgi:hypothetical protein